MILTWSWQLFKYFTAHHRPLSAFFGVYIYPVIYVLENPFLLSHQIFIERHNPPFLFSHYQYTHRISFQIRRKSSVYFYIILSENNSQALLPFLPLDDGSVVVKRQSNNNTDLLDRKQQRLAVAAAQLGNIMFKIYYFHRYLRIYTVKCTTLWRRSLDKWYERFIKRKSNNV